MSFIVEDVEVRFAWKKAIMFRLITANESLEMLKHIYNLYKTQNRIVIRDGIQIKSVVVC